MPSLSLLHGTSVSRCFPLSGTETSIARSLEAGISIDDLLLRDTHALVRCDGSHFIVSPATLDALVSVNGQRVRRAPLAQGDRIELGDSVLVFHLLEAFDERRPLLTADDAVAGARLLVDYAQHLLEDHDLEHMLSQLLDAAITLTDADRGLVFVLEGGLPRLAAARNAQGEDLGGAEVLASDALLERVLRSGKPLLVADTQRSAEYRETPTLLRLRFAAVLCLPLVERGQVLGALYLGKTEPSRLFHEQTLEILVPFTVLTALLLRGARLLDPHFFYLLARPSQAEEQAEIIAASRSMQQVLRVVRKVAPTDATVLITGETGTGKELVARELHRRSQRRQGPLVAVNCAAIPAALIEETLFGHEAGAYTDAGLRRAGLLQAAHGGTLLLDEIGDLPYALQAKLLRVLEEKAVWPLGATEPQPFDVRVVAATHRDLAAEVHAGRFREDLYWRLNSLQIELPPLRQRGVDRVLLARYFLRRASEALGRRERALSPAAVRAIHRHHWPGNVRELEQRIRSAVILGDTEAIEMEDLGLCEERLPPLLPLAAARDRFARRYVREVVDRYGGDEKEAALKLEVDVRTLRRYLETAAGDEERDDAE